LLDIVIIKLKISSMRKNFMINIIHNIKVSLQS